MPERTDSDIAGLKERLLAMASRAEGAVNRAVKALLRRDDELALRTREEDSFIDALEKEIDERALRLLTRQPSPSELRFLAMSMKIARNLERVGDEATTISRRVLELSHEPQLPQAAQIPRLAGLALGLLKESLDAFVRRDAAAARALIPRDREVDALNKALQAELAGSMAQRPSTITRCLNLMVIAKSLERIGDHAANVAEEVVYLCEGQDIRHQPASGNPGPEPTS